MARCGFSHAAPRPIRESLPSKGVPADCLDNCLNSIIINALCLYQPRHTPIISTRNKRIYLGLSGRDWTRRPGLPRALAPEAERLSVGSVILRSVPNLPNRPGAYRPARR